MIKLKLHSLLWLSTLLLVSNVNAQGRSQITTGQTIAMGQYLVSPNQQFTATMQTDGNFVVRQNGRFVWGSVQAGNYNASNGQYFAVISGDGNFCVCRGTLASNQGALWCSMKTAPGGQFLLVLQDDGNLVAYKGATGAGGFLWNTGVENVAKKIGDSFLGGIVFWVTLNYPNQEKYSK